MRAYAIGDIHGHLDLLKAAHDRIAADMAQHGPAPIIHLGDLVDRGPDSRGTIDWLMQGIRSGKDWHVIKGNHDRMFSRFMHAPHEPEPGLRADLSWLHPRLGGGTTLGSYGIANASDRPVDAVHAEALQKVDPAHIAFIDGLPTYIELGADLLFVHAGIRPGVAIKDQTETDLVWIREGWLDQPQDHGPLVVHGHTALPHAVNYGHRLNIDSSAAYGGPLTAVAIEGRDVFVLGDHGRVPLLPTPDAPIR